LSKLTPTNADDGVTSKGDGQNYIPTKDPAELRAWRPLDTVPDALVVITDQGNIHSISVAAVRLFGYTSEEVVGQNVGILLCSPDWGQHRSYFARYLSTGERHIVGVGQRKNCETFPMELAIAEADLPGMRLFTAFIRDLTDRDESVHALRVANIALERLAGHLAKARDVAERSNRAKSRFLAGVSPRY
jgi:PAS domain S-box-containing protein